MKTKLLILGVTGFVLNSCLGAQSGGGAVSGAASGSQARTAGAARPIAPANVTVQPQNAAMQQTQQALQQQQIQQAQQAAAATQQGAGAASTSQQGSQTETTLVPNASQIGPAAQPPQVGVATSISATPGQAAQAPSPGTVPQNGSANANGTITGSGAIQSNGTLANGAIQNLGTNGAGAIVPATVGTLGGVPVVGVPTVAGQNIQTNPNPALAVQPNETARPQALAPIARPAKPTLALDDLPDAVQKVLKGELGDGSLYSLERTSSNLGVAYKAGFKTGNKFREIQIAQDGTVINDSRDTPAVIAATVQPAPQTTKISELPQAVLNAVKAYGSANEIQNIELAPAGDRSVYHIRVAHGGKVNELQIAKDGNVIRNVALDPFALPNSSNLAATATGAAPGSVKGTAINVPEAVRNTINAQGGGIQVQNIQLATVNGRTVYDVSARSNNKPVRLQIAEDGAIVNGQGLTVSVADLPDKVQRKVKSEVGGAVISGIQKEARDGKTIYDVRYGSDTGKDTHLLLAEDGTIVPTKTASPREAAGGPANSTPSRLQLSDLPDAAKTAIRNRAGTAPVDDLRIRTRQGQTIYSATFQKDGNTQTVDVKEDGTILDSQ